MLRDLPTAVQFYQKGLGLRLARSSDIMAEFDTGGEFCVVEIELMEGSVFIGL